MIDKLQMKCILFSDFVIRSQMFFEIYLLERYYVTTVLSSLSECNSKSLES